jgi:REP element-mobilizing transposase RayT
MLRGIEKRRIFVDDHDRRDLLARLGRVFVEARMPCFAWALMPNHVHLVVRTGPVPLARAMARIGTGYAQAFNRRHDRAGHLFQNRYKSILVDDENQLLALVRYVHLNPLRAGLVASLRALGRYPWTGYATLLGHVATDFQASRAVLSRFAPEPAEARRRLRAWMAEKPDRALERASEGDAAGTVEPALRGEDGPALGALIVEVCSARGVAPESLRSGSRTRAITTARAEVVQRACRDLGLTGAELARSLGLSRSAISQLRNRPPPEREWTAPKN